MIYCQYLTTSMFRRKAMDRLIEWRSDPRHKSLLLCGQRHVGKTSVVLEFAKSYEHSVRIDLSEDEPMRRIFEGSIDPDRIVQAIEILHPEAELHPGSTLIVFDEAQRCPQAISSLKPFTRDKRYDVIAV